MLKIFLDSFDCVPVIDFWPLYIHIPKGIRRFRLAHLACDFERVNANNISVDFAFSRIA